MSKPTLENFSVRFTTSLLKALEVAQEAEAVKWSRNAYITMRLERSLIDHPSMTGVPALSVEDARKIQALQEENARLRVLVQQSVAEQAYIGWMTVKQREDKP